MWDKQIQHFSKFHCIVPELIDDDMHFSIEECARKLLKIIEEKAQGKHVTVVGFSLGAQIIVKMLSLNAQLIDNAIINSALVIPSPITKKADRTIHYIIFSSHKKINHSQSFKLKHCI